MSIIEEDSYVFPRRSVQTVRRPLATSVLVLTLLAGAVPAILTNQAVAAQEAQAKRSVIVELARGTDPKGVARSLGVTPTIRLRARDQRLRGGVAGPRGRRLAKDARRACHHP